MNKKISNTQYLVPIGCEKVAKAGKKFSRVVKAQEDFVPNTQTQPGLARNLKF